MGTMESSMANNQRMGILNASEACVRLYGESSLVNSTKAFFNETLGSVMCPAYFDTIMCWPPTVANTTASFTCPAYILGFNNTQNATRTCLNDRWVDWTNYTTCIIDQKIQIEVPIELNKNAHDFEKYLPAIRTLSNTGYTVSLVALLIAFTIMISIKKLHCPRNKLHMHLFASFIFRAFITLLKGMSFYEGLGLRSDIVVKDGHKFFVENKDSRNWECKLMYSLFQFFVTANYSWILMEGLFLHNLIFRAMFADSSRNITHYIVLGWGMPLSVTIVWIILRILIDDTWCWTTNEHSLTFLIIRVPTAISILVNLILFVRIAVVIYSKLQAPVYEEARRYQKWARSTLVLAPLFGIHYALLIGMSSWMNKNQTIELVWLFADQLFASFQGFVVAFLYCFLNSEVRTELKPYVHSFLTYAATDSCFKCIFPCRERYLRSAKARPSVCTTMSCSSLFNNGINHHRNSRTRSDLAPRTQNGSVLERSKDQTTRSNTNIKNWHEPRWNNSRCSTVSTKHCSFSSNGSIPNERTTCLDIQEKSKSESHLGTETVCMLPKNGA